MSEDLDSIISAATGAVSDAPSTVTDIENEQEQQYDGHHEDVPANDSAEGTDATADESIEGEATEPKTDEETRLSAPDKWSGFAKTKFARLPQDVQKEVLNCYKSYEEGQKVYNSINQITEPYKDAISQTYGGVEGMLNHYITLDKAAASDPVGLIKWFMGQRGITPQQLFGQAAVREDMAPNDPSLNKIAELEARLAHYEQRVEESRAQEVHALAASKIEEFVRNPKYPFYQDLRQQMGELIGAGMAKTLEEAYDKALRLNDKISKELEESKKQERNREQLEKARKAKQAASIKATPNSGTTFANGSTRLTVDQVVSEAMAGRL